MEDWLVKLLPDAPLPVVLIAGAFILILRVMSYFFSLLRPGLANDIKEIKKIVEHLDICVDEVKGQVGHVKERVAFIEGTMERRKLSDA